MYNKDLALNNLQELICHKTTNQPTSHKNVVLLLVSPLAVDIKRSNNKQEQQGGSDKDMIGQQPKI